jgi:hypothetical protein
VPAEATAEDQLAARRLTGLLDYVEALVKLDERVATRLSQHKLADGSGWSFWRCFGSNYSLDQEGVMDDLVQTLERMQIKPIGRETANRGFSEHRIIPPVADTSSETIAMHVGGTISVATLQADLDAASNDAEAEYRLVTGDRVVIQYLDVEPSRPELFTMSDITDDLMNGYLLLTSPLGKALSRGSPGDELSFQAGERERSVLFVSLETVSAQAA